MRKLVGLSMALMALPALACDGGESAGQGEADQDDGGEEWGEDPCEDPGQGLLAFEFSGEALTSTVIDLPADWALEGSLGHGDFDGDGLTDVVVGRRVVFGPISASSDSVEFEVGELVLIDALGADLDGDGRDELFVSLQRDLDSIPDLRAFTISTEREISAGELPAWADESSSGILSMAAGDVSGDGFVDLVVGGPNFSLAGSGGHMAILKGDGGGGFLAVELVDYAHPAGAGYALQSMTLADADGIGGLDILSTHEINVYSGSRPADFILVSTGLSEGASVHEQTEIGTSRSAAFIDFTQDGELDAISWDTHIRVAAGQVGGGFGDTIELLEAPGFFLPGAILAAEDLDGDGELDLMAGGGHEGGDLILARGLGEGVMSAAYVASTPGVDGHLHGAKVLDLDDDGDLEVVSIGSWCDEY